ncbi:carboxypeptidase regulatory-like domain-containing protein [Fibrobacter sp.]|uniref:carboxypeptidase regulatory-like domain-containing protein n=1 Tax=Fibrobacter sp. TaxID=35828 RepID=UPI0025BFE2F1|nr:carboxypeptidase regulatory-like domain-containing protein [Fibrobacter sp.]MBR3073712.1 carboxypeptidase regulatory-like domain-containing protein [Fibrobacter sp.]
MKKLLAFLFCILLLACSSDKEIAGASTVETENACIINVVNIDSKPAANVVARIRPLWHVQGISDSDSTFSHNETLEVTADSLGNIVMDSVIDSVDFETGYIEIIDGNAGIFKTIASNNLRKNKLTTMQMETLGSVSGKAELPEGTAFAWIQIFGTDKLIKTNKKGEFTLDSLPPASYQIRAIVSDEQEAIGEATVQVSADKNSDAKTLAKPSLANEKLEQWQHSRAYPLDSVISDWMKPIAESTVVFIRLDSANFDFSETMKNGNDIRITDQSGNRLDFKKAFWNDSLKQAELQIRINGTSNVESVVMHWGKTAAFDASTNDVWTGLPDSLVTSLHSVKIIDFEKQRLETAFDYANGPREWYFHPQDSNVTTTPSNKNVQEAFEKSDERGGYVFHWKSTSKVKGKWSMIGVRINQNPSSLESIDSIAFYAKGKGELGFAIEVLDEPTGKTKYVDYLDSNWKRFSFTPSDFVEGDGEYGNMGWNFVKSRVTTITIWIVDDSEMWIDEVILYGVNRDNFN